MANGKARKVERAAQEAMDAQQRLCNAETLNRDAVLALVTNGVPETGIVQNGSTWAILDTDPIAELVTVYEDPVDAVIALYDAHIENGLNQDPERARLEVVQRGETVPALLD